MLEPGEADALVVGRLDCLSLSLLNFASIILMLPGWANGTGSGLGQLIASIRASVRRVKRRLVG